MSPFRGQDHARWSAPSVPRRGCEARICHPLHEGDPYGWYAILRRRRTDAQLHRPSTTGGGDHRRLDHRGVHVLRVPGLDRAERSCGTLRAHEVQRKTSLTSAADAPTCLGVGRRVSLSGRSCAPATIVLLSSYRTGTCCRPRTARTSCDCTGRRSAPSPATCPESARTSQPCTSALAKELHDVILQSLRARRSDRPPGRVEALGEPIQRSASLGAHGRPGLIEDARQAADPFAG